MIALVSFCGAFIGAFIGVYVAKQPSDSDDRRLMALAEDVIELKLMLEALRTERMVGIMHDIIKTEGAND